MSADWPELFRPQAAWNAKIDAFQFNPLMTYSGSPAAITQAVHFLAGHHIKVAMGVDTILLDRPARTPGECGFGNEGTGRFNGNLAAFRRLKAMGAEVDFVVMDEPLTFGHFFTRQNACQYPIPVLAEKVARAIAEIRVSYPNVRVVDTEAPSITSPGEWNAEFGAWIRAYRNAAGAPLDSVLLDLNWRSPWPNVVVPSIATAHANGVRAGIILNGSGPVGSDSEAVDAILQNVRAYQASGIVADFVEIANWTAHPSRNLPAADPDTLSFVLAWYNAHRRR
jgi:hypothetical protein